ncbi:unnamed protein product [Cladocopium goreaui]|uniref:NarX-like N-terminal domain-containing protein n=1 Tax=Cladocopium goreaui TaxID=2562237 RepID=A0A9P1DMX2_9DINO|nr:unnamed protein product [Cladocopium goreaui]
MRGRKRWSNDALLWNGFPFRCLWFVVQLFMGQAQELNWGKTIDVAGRQRMLTQRMSKEFLQVALDIDAADNRGRMLGSINLFNVSLYQLINGDSVTGIVGTPNHLVGSGLDEVVSLWKPFSQLLLNNVDTIRDASGFVDMNIISMVEAQNVPVLVKSNVVVGRLVDAAQSAGAPTNGLVVDTAGRQRMLIQRMCKEALLIGLGSSITTNVGRLKGTQLLFLNSHAGIVEGATWAGVPVLNKLCTMHQMREVTYNMQVFSPLLNQILNAHTASESQNIANSLAKQISDMSVPLFSSMVRAVQLYVNDADECDPAASMGSTDWQDLLLRTDELLLLEEQANQYYLQIGNAVRVATSQVGLVVTLNTILDAIDNLVQGNKGLNILAPPSQAALDGLLAAKSQWDELQLAYEPAVSNINAVTAVEVTKIDRLGTAFQSRLLEIVNMYETVAFEVRTTTSPSPLSDPVVVREVPIHTIQVAHQQKANAAKIASVANLVAYSNGSSDDFGGVDLVNQTRDNFIATHYSLLEGKPATGLFPAIAEEHSVCAIRQMQDIYTDFVAVDRYAQEGKTNPLMLGPLADAVEKVITKYTAVIDYYKQGSIACSNRSYVLAEWELLIEAVGSLRSLTQEACADYILATQGTEPIFQERSDRSMAALLAAFRALAYGTDTLPAPPSQSIFDQVINKVKPAFDLFIVAVTEANTMNVVLQGDNVAVQGTEVKRLYFDQALSTLASFPVGRLEAGQDQQFRVNQMVKLSFMFIYDITATTTTLQNSIAEFDAVHLMLKDGGPDIPAIVDQRDDLLTQWSRVDGKWKELKQLLLTRSVADVPNLQATKDILIEEMIVLQGLFAIPDQPVAETFPWMFVAYGAMGLFLLSCACGAVYIHFVSRRKKSTQNQNGWSQA